MKTKKVTEFEIGKFYKAQKPNPKAGYFMKIIREDYCIIIKNSNFKNGENYIMIDSIVFHNPKDCIEIPEEQFIEAKNSVLEKIVNYG